MAERVVLHIGLLKTGTSYLQKRLSSGGESLAEHGIVFPEWRDQVDAVIDILGIQRRPRPSSNYDQAWLRMVTTLTEAPAVGLMSMEFLGPAREAQAEAVIRSFGAVPVEVVITARDLNRAIVAMWQETAKNSGAESWSDYLEAIRVSKGVGARFWRQQKLAVTVQRWAKLVGIENVTVVTVPPPDAPSETLWERFCQATRIGPELCPPVRPANESLGAASAELLRRVNQELAEGEMSWKEYSKVVKFGFAKRILAKSRSLEEPLGMAVPPWVAARAAGMRRNTEATGVRVVGTLDDLVPVAGGGITPDEVSVEAQLDAAVRALTLMLRRDMAEIENPEAEQEEEQEEQEEQEERPVE